MISQLSPRRWNAYVLTLKMRKRFLGELIKGPTQRMRMLRRIGTSPTPTLPNLHKSRRRLLAVLAVSISAISSGCSHSPVPLRAVLPEPPTDFGRPVVPPLPHVGQSPKAYSASVLSALAQANDRLVNDAAFYSDVKEKLGNDGQ
jgi:hypothetical protein